MAVRAALDEAGQQGLKRVSERFPEVSVEVGVDERVERRVEVADPEQYRDDDIGTRASIAAQRSDNPTLGQRECRQLVGTGLGTVKRLPVPAPVETVGEEGPNSHPPPHDTWTVGGLRRSPYRFRWFQRHLILRNLWWRQDAAPEPSSWCPAV
uniref:Uncharacterized protein n=1 Tax=Anopheles farauti TaxID=69004 RepID=A0A182QBX4_9DIPT